jgi:hypothetical protein
MVLTGEARGMHGRECRRVQGKAGVEERRVKREGGGCNLRACFKVHGKAQIEERHAEEQYRKKSRTLALASGLGRATSFEVQVVFK